MKQLLRNVEGNNMLPWEHKNINCPSFSFWRYCGNSASVCSREISVVKGRCLAISGRLRALVRAHVRLRGTDPCRRTIPMSLMQPHCPADWPEGS